MIVCPLAMMGQNLVQNGSFEINTGLPSAPAQWNLASNWSNANSSSASPDYLHTSGSGVASLPNSIFGTVMPYQGNAVMGLAMLYPNTPNFREYVSQQLAAPLVVGNSYTFSFYISNGVPANTGGLGIKNVQVHFSVTPINQIGSAPFNYTPLLSSNTIIYSSSWVPVSFTFTATSPYAYFAIGNFMNDAGTTSQSFVPVPNPCAYYFIDEVSLIPNNVGISITGGQSICNGNSTVLTGSGAASYTWQPGNITTSTISVTPSVTTTYTLTGTVGGSTLTTAATVTVNSLPGVSAATNGMLTCSATSVALNGSPSSGVTYTWSGPGLTGGLNGQSAVATAAGSYTLQVTDVASGCANMATTIVTQNTITPSPAASAGTLTCYTTTLGLTGTPSSGVSYAWSGPGIISGANTSSPVVNLPGTYSLTVTDPANGCSATATATVFQNNAAPAVTITYAYTCGTPTVQLSANSSVNTVNYNWIAPALGTLDNNGISNPVATGSGVYTVVVTNTVNGCAASQTANLLLSSSALSVSVNSATICSGTSTTITATGNAAAYSWAPAGSLSASSGSVVTASPIATSIYTVTGTMGSCSVAVEFTVDVISSPTISVTSSTNSVCAGSQATLQVSGASSYAWAPAGTLSSSTASLVIANPALSTTYSVTGTNGTAPHTCTDEQSVLITVIPNIAGVVSAAAEICEGGSTMLYAAGGTVKWLPTTGLANSNVAVTKASPLVSTTYTALISSNGFCSDSKTIDVIVNPNPQVNAGADTTIAFGDSLTLTGTGVGTLAWISGDFLTCNHCRNAFIIPEESSCYVLESLTDKGCKSYDEICVTVDKQSAFYIPNTFTPNGDEKNDVFNVVGFGITDMELLIFNRWGTLIYKTNELTKGWDGKNKGALCESGVYIYQVTVKTISKEIQEKTGHVTLLGK